MTTVLDFDLDELLEAAVLEGAMAAGRDPLLAAAQFGASRVIGRPAAADGRDPLHGQSNRWSPEDDAFLRCYAGVLSEPEIAAQLGRSVDAVGVRIVRAGLPGPHTHPDYITAGRAAWALGVDGHAVITWIERGMLAAEVAPTAGRLTWRIRRTTFDAWAMNPANWVYFIRSVREPERLRDERLRRLIGKRAAMWGDAWWSVGETADYHGVEVSDVNRYINAGRLPGVQWGNWWILRSAATRPGLIFFKGKGGGVFARGGTPAGDAFIVLAAAVGVPWTYMARMMGRYSHSGVQIRYQSIQRRGLVPWFIRAYELPVDYRAADGATWADWRPLAHRFPQLARAWEQLDTAVPSRHDARLLAGALGSFLRFHAPEHPLARSLTRGGVATADLRNVKALYLRMMGE